MRLVYSLALVLGILVASPILAGRMAKGRYRRIALSRLGLGSAWLPPAPGQAGLIWVHALSVGEVGSALPLLKALKDRFPQRPLAFSVATAQGLAVASEFLAENPEVTLFVRPLDLPWAVERLLDRLKPSLFCLVEGDIWPNWQWSMAKRGVPRLLVNGRVSPRTFKGYLRLGPLARHMLNGFDRILAQTSVDQTRLLRVGVAPKIPAVGGNLKFDSAPAELDDDGIEAMARELGLTGRTVLAAGSTHPGEEEPCLEAFAALRRKYPGLALLLAPREVSRGRAVARMAEDMGLRAQRVSQGEISADADVVVLDVLGRLAQAYALASAAFVGGSLVPVGGHNLLEPAAQGVPVLFGPHTHNFLQMAQDLEAAGGGIRLKHGQELQRAWGELLADQNKAGLKGRAAQAFCRAHQGAVARAVEEAAILLGEAHDPK